MVPWGRKALLERKEWLDPLGHKGIRAPVARWVSRDLRANQERRSYLLVMWELTNLTPLERAGAGTPS